MILTPRVAKSRSRLRPSAQRLLSLLGRSNKINELVIANLWGPFMSRPSKAAIRPKLRSAFSGWRLGRRVAECSRETENG